MNSQQLPSVELIQGAPPAQPSVAPRGRRWKVFTAVLLATLAIGLAFVYGRTPVYRATASVLTVKPKAVDTPSTEADVEHVTIQGRLLLGEDLLGRVSRRLREEGDGDLADVDRLRGALAVVPIPETNLLELRADGEDPAQLQRLINLWAESYEGFRAEEIEAATGRTTAELEDEQGQLELKIDAARAQLQAFREANDIISLERGENRSLAKLKGLNDSLNKARDRLIEARAKKTAIDEAIARGETVIPSEQKSDISRMKLTLQRGRVRLAELRERYTQAYIDRDPVLKSLPDELRAMESELRLALQLAGTTVRDEAQQAVEAARASVAAAEQELADHQKSVQQFTESFKEFKSLEDNLARLDALLGDNQERLAQIQVRNLKKYPPIQIVEWARLPTQPIYPDYERDLMIALAGALGLALFVTWLVEYLSERSQTAHTAPYLGVRVYSGEQGQQPLAAPNAGHHLPDQRSGDQAASAPRANLPILPRELALAETRSLLTALDAPTAGYAALLLSGISPYEIPMLHADCFDRDREQVNVPGAGRRGFNLDTGAWQLIERVIGDLGEARMAVPLAELDSRLGSAAKQAGLADPDTVNALSLWHTFVLYLVRQGIDASALTRRVGEIPPELIGTLMRYAPPDGTRPLGTIDFTYPALAA